MGAEVRAGAGTGAGAGMGAGARWQVGARTGAEVGTGARASRTALINCCKSSSMYLGTLVAAKALATRGFVPNGPAGWMDNLCNVMITRPTSHMIATRDLRTSSWHQVIINTIIRVITCMAWLHPGPSFVIQLLHLLIIMACIVHHLKT